MAKLHEVLAVEGDLEGTYKKILQEAVATFSKKDEHFNGYFRQVRMFAEESADQPEEHKEMVTTVHDKLDYVWEHITRYLNAFAQKERTNQDAKSDIEVNGSILAKAVPATMLLGLETKLKQIRAIYENIPTLALGIEWVEDPQRGEHVYKAKHLDEKHKTAKRPKSKVLYDATKEHPAQIEKWTEDEPVGMIETERWSGMLSPAEKSKFIGKVDELLRAVKQARQRANCEEVKLFDIGKAIFNYIHS